MIRFHVSLLWTILVAAVVATAVPGMTFAQATGAGVDSTPAHPGPTSSAGTAASGAPEAADTDNFYFRAGVVLDWSTQTRFRDEDCSSASPAALYGCGKGIDGAPRGSLGDFGTMAGFEFGLGYGLAPALRLEALIQHRPNFSFEGRANFNQTTGRQKVSADVSSLSGMLAVYLDLPELGLPRLGPFSPFIGAGGGLSRVAIDETRMQFTRTTTIVPGGDRVNLAWMLTAGLAAPLGERVTLDLAWRYTDHGVVETGKGLGRRAGLSGTTGPATRWCSVSPGRAPTCEVMDCSCPCATRSEAGVSARSVA